MHKNSPMRQKFFLQTCPAAWLKMARDFLIPTGTEGNISQFTGPDPVSSCSLPNASSPNNQVRKQSTDLDAQIDCIQLEDIIQAHKLIRASGVPNFLGQRIPVKSDLNIPSWREHLCDYFDQQPV